MDCNDTPEVGTGSRECLEPSAGAVDEYVLIWNGCEYIEGKTIRASDSDNCSFPEAGGDGEAKEHQHYDDRGKDDGTSGHC